MQTFNLAQPSQSWVLELLSLRTLLLPALIVYGFMVKPLTGDGALPCLWRALFGFECPGCGLSRADALFVRGSFLDALSMNWLIAPVWLVAFEAFLSQVLNLIKQRK